MTIPSPWLTVDGNEATARIAYKLSEIIAIYPITPSSTMGELADAWMAAGQPNLWGTVPSVIEMQSEGGAAGALHGAVQTGALATSFTASQGLLLMLPNMFKMAGQLLPCVLHVSARAVATHALSIFGDHSDVMAVRAAGWALLCSGSVQEAQDLAVIAHASTLTSRVPVLHFFDGFRTSHEVAKIHAVSDDDLLAMIDEAAITEHRRRALSPDHPVLRGSAQNPDVFFQGREAANPFYLECPARVEEAMDRFAVLTGRSYHLFDYEGAPDADRVVVMMGSGAETAGETVAALNDRGERVGLLKVRLFRPFNGAQFVRTLPATVRHIAVLDRTKEPGATGEPLYQEVVAAIGEALDSGEAPFRFFPRVIGGRYGLGSKEFTPAMARTVFRELDQSSPRTHFTVGINDDVSFASLPYTPFPIEAPGVVEAVFYGLGSDGTVGANKNTIKIIGEETPLHAQGYFVYDSKKSGSTTVSHLRFGPRPIRSSYLIERAGFVACHQWELLHRLDVLERAADGATVLLNSPYAAADVWDHLPRRAQQHIVDRGLELHVVDAGRIAAEAGTGRRVNTVLQACFFALSGVLPRDQAVAAMKRAVRKSYGVRGERVLEANFAAIDAALDGLHQVEIPDAVSAADEPETRISDAAPAFVRRVTAPLVAGEGDRLPVSALPPDGTFPVGTSKWEKRNIADSIPVWHEETCIQCGKCALVCPHAAVRIKALAPAMLKAAPTGFKSIAYRGHEFEGMSYTIQVSPEDCTGCELCVEICPARDRSTGVKALTMAEQRPLREQGRAHFEFFLRLPEVDRAAAKHGSVKGSQFLQPLFEFSGACSGCGETPYLKLISQLFGDRMIVANATGCSSIFGGNLPTTPWTCNREGLGPAWANSLFEDNAEFGLGMRITVDKQAEQARVLLREQADIIDAGSDPLVEAILASGQADEPEIFEQRNRVGRLKRRLRSVLDTTPGHLQRQRIARLLELADYLVKKSVWIVGGDGWAYDIGYGGLDHVLASNRNVNVLVLDTEVYSNTGGQASKATPRGAVARFAAAGKRSGKKDLGLLAMMYGHVYVAHIALGANDTQTVKALLEAEAYDGPSLVIAYAHCIAHGLDVKDGLAQQARAVASGHWPLFRFDPRQAGTGRFPLTLDSKPPRITFADYAYREGRYNVLRTLDREAAEQLAVEAQHDIDVRWQLYEHLAHLNAGTRGSGVVDRKSGISGQGSGIRDQATESEDRGRP
ncbi:MAG TPA: pyruvate:ferredoxin (flavodoxin) oxidoreductase [Vicinamibacterales bacterium]|nr:pyruvate:ferredoxin (flavodoxin) oxidoreductase [Vicinamibacterales bacterium]